MTVQTHDRLAVVLVSGGLDSATLAYSLYHDEGYRRLLFLSFNYGQRHSKEIVSALAMARLLGAEHHALDMRFLAPFLTGSALTDKSVVVPHGHYHEETMRQTVVPNRNAIMLSIAWGIAAARGADCVAIAAHAGDHFIYPDCRIEFIEPLNTAFRLGSLGHRREDLHLKTPFIFLSKAEIVAVGARLAVPFEKTWTCYEGGELHCGECGACNERREAFIEAQVSDPTIYAANLYL